MYQSGLRAGMGKAQDERVIEVWLLAPVSLRPTPEAEGKNPMQLDSKEPDWSKFRTSKRWGALHIVDEAIPEEAEELFKAEDAKWRYNGYKRMSEQDFTLAEEKPKHNIVLII